MSAAPQNATLHGASTAASYEQIKRANFNWLEWIVDGLRPELGDVEDGELIVTVLVQGLEP